MPLESQIPLSLQDESARIYGFRGTHAGLLNDAAFLRHFSNVMAKQDSDGARGQL